MTERTLTTRLFTYRFNLPEDGEKVHQMRLSTSTRTAPGHPHNGHSVKHSWMDKIRDAEQGSPVTLECAHLFHDQWNSTEFGRVFDHCEFSWQDPSIITGYWLEQTDEMREIRDKTYRSPYSGKYCSEAEALAEPFELEDLTSEYLKRHELHLTRRYKVSYGFGPRVPLTEAELERLMPIWINKQQKRRTKQILNLGIEQDRKLEHMRREFHGQVWLLERGNDIENWLYYNHIGAGTFCYGWRDKTTERARGDDRALEDFPYPWEFKKA